MRIRGSLCTLGVVIVAVTGAGGCSTMASQEAAAGAVARAFHRAVASGDGGAACRLLTSAAQSAVEDSGSDCPKALLDLDLPQAEQVTQVRVWGRSAQVSLTGDVLFLTVADGRWQVRAAGCEPLPGAPYDCSVDGT